MGTWRAIRVFYYLVLFSVFASIAFYFGPNLILFRKLTWLDPSDFRASAERRIFVVQALKTYRADYGYFPSDIKELVPKYLLPPPPNNTYLGEIRDNEYKYWGPFNHTISYRFTPGQEGWWVRGVYVDGAIPLPLVAPPSSTRPADISNRSEHSARAEGDR